MKIEPCSTIVKIPATLVHVIAVLVTIFRLLYRWRISRFWWEDTWAALALISDIGCLASIWMETVPCVHANKGALQLNLESYWLLEVTLTSIVWFARMSILCSIVRITNPTLRLRRIAYCIGAMFLLTEAGLLAQKIAICVKNKCFFTDSVAIAQLVTDVISDAILVAAPIRFLQDVRLPRNRRILILSVFSASLLITAITILHSVLVMHVPSNTTFIIGHIKAALSLLVCNALVLVTFIYRVSQRLGGDLEVSIDENGHARNGNNAVEFTTVINLPSKFSSQTSPMTSGADSGETTSNRTQG